MTVVDTYLFCPWEPEKGLQLLSTKTFRWRWVAVLYCFPPPWRSFYGYVWAELRERHNAE